MDFFFRGEWPEYLIFKQNVRLNRVVQSSRVTRARSLYVCVVAMLL